MHQSAASGGDQESADRIRRPAVGGQYSAASARPPVLGGQKSSASKWPTEVNGRHSAASAWRPGAGGSRASVGGRYIVGGRQSADRRRRSVAGGPHPTVSGRRPAVFRFGFLRRVAGWRKSPRRPEGREHRASHSRRCAWGDDPLLGVEPQGLRALDGVGGGEGAQVGDPVRVVVGVAQPGLVVGRRYRMEEHLNLHKLILLMAARSALGSCGCSDCLDMFGKSDQQSERTGEQYCIGHVLAPVMHSHCTSSTPVLHLCCNATVVRWCCACTVLVPCWCCVVFY